MASRALNIHVGHELRHRLEESVGVQPSAICRYYLTRELDRLEHLDETRGEATVYELDARNAGEHIVVRLHGTLIADTGESGRWAEREFYLCEDDQLYSYDRIQRTLAPVTLPEARRMLEDNPEQYRSAMAAIGETPILEIGLCEHHGKR